MSRPSTPKSVTFQLDEEPLELSEDEYVPLPVMPIGSDMITSHYIICVHEGPFSPPPYAVLSQHPVKQTPEVSVKMVPAWLNENNASELIGCAVCNNTIRKRGIFGSVTVFYRTLYYRNLTENAFRLAIRQGLLFRKLELNGTFFCESYLFPEGQDIKKSIVPIVLPNLKEFIIRIHLLSVYKGNEPGPKTKSRYIKKQSYHFRKLWSRASFNLWFILKTITSLKMHTFILEDFCKWELLIGSGNDFIDVLREVEEPLLELIQRNGRSLKVLKLNQAIMNEEIGRIRYNEAIPKLEELQFGTKMAFDINLKQKNPKKMAELRAKMNTCLAPWQKLWSTQTTLTKLEWLCEKHNPWTYTKTDFIKLVKLNKGLETVILTFHSPTELLKYYKVMRPLLKPDDQQFDCQHFAHLTFLKTLAYSCFERETLVNRFSVINFESLPKGLENVHIFGMSIMESELEHLTRLPKLLNLSIIQPTPKKFSAEDELNGNIEGVGTDVLQKIINMRSLEQLCVSGFPTKIENETEGFTLTQPLMIPGPRTLKSVLKESNVAARRNEIMLEWLKRAVGDEDAFSKNLDQNGNEVFGYTFKDPYLIGLHNLLKSLCDAGTVIEREIYPDHKITLVVIGDECSPYDHLFID